MRRKLNPFKASLHILTHWPDLKSRLAWLRFNMNFLKILKSVIRMDSQLDNSKIWLKKHIRKSRDFFSPMYWPHYRNSSVKTQVIVADILNSSFGYNKKKERWQVLLDIYRNIWKEFNREFRRMMNYWVKNKPLHFPKLFPKSANPNIL